MPKARCVLWIDPIQAPILRRVIERADIELVGAGCPDPARTGQVASDLQCDPVDDLRSALTHKDTDLILLANPGSFADQAIDADLDSLKAAHARNVCVASLEPIPATANQIAGTSFAEVLQTGALNELVRFVPLTRHTPIATELNTVLETFGPIRSCSLTLGSPALLGSLGARLFDAMDLVRSFVGVPNIIDASFISPAAGRGMHPLPGQSLRNLVGEFTMNLRFSDGRCASVLLSDQLGASSMHMTLLGSEGHIEVNTTGFRWYNPAGEQIDSFKTDQQTNNQSESTDPVESALTAQLIEICSGVGPTHAPIDYQSVLSMTHSTLLSTRTGQGESPRAVEQLMLSM